MNRDLFLAILSMDSYNRGYGPGVNLPGILTHIGRAEVLPDSEQRPGLASGQSSGFYALAYDVSRAGIAGLTGTVISYRGTNDLSSDIYSYGIAVGQPFALTGGLTDQARLTIEFYRAVAGDTDPFTANITTTGHSLGGGLAGYAAMLYGTEATIFNNMAFEEAATATRGAALIGMLLGVDQTLVYGNGPIYALNSSGIDAYATTGEFLAFNRILQQVDVTYLDSNGGWRWPGTLHSMALHVALQFAKAQDAAIGPWELAASYLWDAYFNDELAAALPGAANISSDRDAGNAMRTAIAYSALDEGERPFGDVAIRAMFDDAADFGRVLRDGALPAWLDGAVNDAIGRIIVEFAGLMALRDVEAYGDNASDITRMALNGVLSNSFTNQGALSAMRISFGAERWAVGGALHPSAQREGLVSTVLDASLSGAQIERVSRWYRENTGIALLPAIDEVIFGMGGDANITPDDADGLALTVLSDTAQTITFGNVQNFAVGGNAGNTMVGGAANDNQCAERQAA